MYVIAIMFCLNLADARTCEVTASTMVYPTQEHCMSVLKETVDSVSIPASGRCVKLDGGSS